MPMQPQVGCAVQPHAAVFFSRTQLNPNTQRVESTPHPQPVCIYLNLDTHSGLSAGQSLSSRMRESSKSTSGEPHMHTYVCAWSLRSIACKCEGACTCTCGSLSPDTSVFEQNLQKCLPVVGWVCLPKVITYLCGVARVVPILYLLNNNYEWVWKYVDSLRNAHNVVWSHLLFRS